MTETPSPLTDPLNAEGWPNTLEPMDGADTSAFADEDGNRPGTEQPVRTHDWPADLNKQNARQPGLKPGNDFIPRPSSP